MNVACSFDIETTSFYANIHTGESVKDLRHVAPSMQKIYEKRATMYAWVFGINGKCVVGRTWSEFLLTLQQVHDYFGLSSDGLILVCFVHNLAFEFQWIKDLFQWESVFATKERTPIKALTKMGIEFRCSLTLSGYSLAKVGEHLQTYKVQKMVGDLDYDLMRHSKTPLTAKEWCYIIHDGLVVMAYIQEELDKRKFITRLPLTKTGYTRDYVRKRCFWSKSSHQHDYSHKYEEYTRLMRALTINGSEEYLMLRQAFQGAIVHANYLNANKTLHDIASCDFTSSYPAVMVAYQYPMSKGKKVMPKNVDELNTYLKCYLSIIDITFHDVESTTNADHIISVSKCVELEECDSDNGRLINAKKIRMVITNIDLETYRHFYRFGKVEINKMYIYRKGYLPTDFVKAVLDLYQQKTTLKGVEGKEAEYLYAKENVNSCYGMCVTDICRGEITYKDGKWVNEEANIDEQIEKYNNQKNRFLFYPWGVFITAYARRNLASGILATGDGSGHYCYCDTDSVKFMNYEVHKDYFASYNEYITRELKKACAFHGIDYEFYCNPVDIKGKHHPLGVWDYEGTYKRAKFLGAKRYAVEFEDGSHSLTIAGVNKKTAVPYLEKEGGDFFDLISFGYTFNEDACGKLLHTYLDEPRSGVLTDFRGVRAKYKELSMVHLEPTTYKMDATPDYLSLLNDVIYEEERWVG